MSYATTANEDGMDEEIPGKRQTTTFSRYRGQQAHRRAAARRLRLLRNRPRGETVRAAHESRIPHASIRVSADVNRAGGDDAQTDRAKTRCEAR